MTDSLAGINANIADIVATNRTHAGRPVFEVRTKLGASLPAAGNLDLSIRRTNPDGGAARIVVPASVITPAPLTMANPFITTPENPAPGSILGQLSASGGVGTKVYGLGSGHNGALSVSPTGLVSVAANVLGELAVPALWNFEAGTSFTAPIQVSDNTGTATATLTISLTNVNEAPSAGNLNIVVRNDQTGVNSVITPLSIISDPDAGSTHSVTIFAGNTAGYFAISGSNLVSTQAIPAGTSTILTMRIVDNGGLISFYTITIIVGSTLITSSTYRVPQVTNAGSAIAVFPSTDATGDPITYAFTSGDSSKFSLTGNILRVAIPLLRNVSATHVFQIQASTANFTDTGTITIVVVANPVISGPQSFSINEGLPAGTTVGSLTIDQAGDPNTQLSIIGTVQAHADLFQISPSGVITTTAVLVNNLPDETIVDGTVINATPIDYPLFIRAVNANTTAAVSGGFVEFSIEVLVVNVPVLQFPAQSLSIAFGAQVGDSIGVLDVDSGRPPYTFAESTPSSAIAVNASTGELTVQNAAPFAVAGQSLTVGVTVTDSSDIPQVIARTITVNVSHALPTISGGPFNVDENRPIGTVVGQLTINKGGDSSATIGLTANQGFGTLGFAVDNNGQITTTQIFDFEAQSSQQVTATITNSAGSNSVSFAIAINNLPEFNFTAASAFVVPSTSLEVAGGTLIGAARVLDTAMFNAATAGPSNAEVLFTINSATDCKFRLNSVDTTTFTRANIIAGAVTFVAVTTATAANYIGSLDSLNPSFTVTVSDTRAGGLASVTVTRSPVFTAEIITFNILDNGIIDNTELLAISVGDTPAETTIQEWTISNGLFERVATPGTRISSWSQAEINNGEIQLIRPNAQTVTNITLRARGANLAQGALASDTVAATAFAFAAQTFSIAENPSNGAAIGNLVISGGVPPYTFVESPASGAIAVNFSTGALTVQNAASFNHEVNPTLTVGVTASDSSSPAQSITRTITVNVTDVGPTLELDDYFVEVADNANTSSPILLTSMSFNLEGVATLSLQSNPHISLANVTATSANLMLTQTVLSSISSPFAVQVRLLSIANSSVLLFDTFTLTIVGGGYGY